MLGKTNIHVSLLTGTLSVNSHAFKVLNYEFVLVIFVP